MNTPMRALSPSLLLSLALSLLPGGMALAQTGTAVAAPPQDAAGKAAADDSTAAQAPKAPAASRRGAARAKPAPAKPPRRAVYQIIDGMPPPAAPPGSAGPAYGPRLTPGPIPVSPSPAPGLTSPGPAVISRCDAGGCTDTGGARYNGASGTLLSPQGRACISVAGVVSCN